MPDEQKRFFHWKPGLTECLFLVGFLFFGLAIWTKQEVFDFIAQALGLRKAFSWITVAATAAFAVYWVRIWLIDTLEPLDEEEWGCAKRLFLASSVLVMELWGGLFLSATDAPRYVWFQLTQLFGYGVYSHRALGIAIAILILLVGNVFVIVRWAVAALNRSVN